MRNETPLRVPGLGFWNLALIVVLGYGGLALLVLTYWSPDQLTSGLGNIGDHGLAILVISAGTAGLLLARDLFVERGWWREAQLFGCCLNFACAAGALHLGELKLAALVATIGGTEWLAEQLCRWSEKDVGEHNND